MHEPIPMQGRWLGQVVRGYFQYHAVPTNYPRAAELIERAATSVPRADVVAALVPLMGDDRYGVRSVLADVIANRKAIP
jgi:hypothetical protein